MVMLSQWIKLGGPTSALTDQNYLIQTRKSPCVNARGIPTAAYQVLHLLSYLGGGGYPIPGHGGVPHFWPGGAPSLAGGLPHPWTGVPHPWVGMCTPSLARGTTSLDRRYPIPGWVPHIWTWPRYSHPDLARAPPGREMARAPPGREMARVPPPRDLVPVSGGTPRRGLGPVTGVPFPQKGHATSGSIMGWRLGTPLPQWWTK